MMGIRRPLVLLCAAMLAACAPSWKLTTATPYKHTSGFTIVFPPGWRWYPSTFLPTTVTLSQPGQGAMASRDGPLLQAIGAEFRPAKRAFPLTKKAVDARTLPEDLATTYIAEFREARELDNVEVRSQKPAKVGGRNGFRTELAWKTGEGLGLQQVVYGVATDKGFYLVSYTAPAIVYFDESLAEFETAAATFALTGT